MVGLGPGTDGHGLHLDEVADMGPLSDLRGGAQARIGADDRVIRHPRPLQMAEGPDGRLAHHHAGPEHHKGLDHGTSGDLRVMAEHDGLRGRHGDARVQKPLPHPLLEGSLRAKVSGRRDRPPRKVTGQAASAEGARRRARSRQHCRSSPPCRSICPRPRASPTTSVR